MARKREPWGPEVAGLAWPKRVRPAPGDLRTVQAFLNSRDPATGVEELEDAEALAGWLRRWGLTRRGAEAPATTPADLELALDARRALRSLLAVHRGGDVDRKALARLEALAERLPMRLRFGLGQTRFEPAGDGFEASLARLFLLIARAQGRNRWRRLKICDDETCRRVFYDDSNNLSARWCSVQCGNRLHARRLRVRKGPKPRYAWR